MISQPPSSADSPPQRILFLFVTGVMVGDQGCFPSDRDYLPTYLLEKVFFLRFLPMCQLPLFDIRGTYASQVLLECRRYY